MDLKQDFFTILVKAPLTIVSELSHECLTMYATSGQQADHYDIVCVWACSSGERRYANIYACQT